MVKFITKFKRGRAIVAGGISGNLFAVNFSCQAALTTGCGIVVCLIPQRQLKVLESSMPGYRIVPIDTILNFKKNKEFNKINNLLLLSSSILIGPGAEWDKKHKRNILKYILKYHKHLPVVIDADCVGSLTKDLLILRKSEGREIIITSNLHETQLLFKKEKITEKDIKKFTSTWNCYLLYKSNGLRLFLPNGTKKSLPIKSLSKMATAGMGDILSGFIVGLLATNYTATEAIKEAVNLRQEAAWVVNKAKILPKTILPENIINQLKNRKSF